MDIFVSVYWWLWLVSFLLLVVLSVPRRRLIPIASLLVLIACAWPMVASRTLWLPAEIEKRPGDVTLVVFNADMGNKARGQVLPFVLELEADIVVVLEPVWDFYISVTRSHAADTVYPGVLERVGEGENARILVLSRWAITRFENEPLANPDGLVCLVHRPEELGGEFVVVAAHPHSPRNPGRWAEGNGSVRRVVGRIDQLLQEGYTVALGADLNAPPGSVRDRILRRGVPLVRSKPIIGRWGSYPASLGFGRIAIDDVWCPPGVVARSWRTIRGPGSDHRAVRAVVSIPGARDEE
ncbi:MAG: endonuclease/exonuclease/phosphatase family protein [Phycisphaerales bacterium]|nr:endonuclease/exonuclease/phosphatase family protein [Phycisphaerales bacterium]